MSYQNVNITKENVHVTQFTNLLKLNDILQGVVLNKLTSSNAYCTNTKEHFSKLNILCTFGLNLKVEIDCFYPVTGSLPDSIANMCKMKIFVHDAEVRNEIRSWTNYLQRQKNLNLAVDILKKLTLAVANRKLILDMLYLHTDGNIITKYDEDGGVSIICKVHEIKYFKASWKIYLNCYTHKIADVIDFTVTKKDTVFYALVGDMMNSLVQPYLSYDTKVNYWTVIVQAVNVKMQEPVIEIMEETSWDQKDYVLVQNLSEVGNGSMEQYEILESDNEDCHIVDN